MGSVYKRPDSKYYQVIYKFRGKYVRESTKCRIKKEAEKILKLREADAIKGIKIHTYQQTKWKDLEKAVIRHYKEKGNKTLSRTEYHLERLRENFEDFLIIDIDESLIQYYKEQRENHVSERTKKPISKTTINRELATLRLGLRLLKRYGKIPTVPHIEEYPEKNARQQYFTSPKYERLIKAVRRVAPHLYGAVQLGRKAGWRSGCIRNIQWSHVDRKNEIIRAPGILTKNGEPVFYPYSEDYLIKEIIVTAWRNRRNLIPYVFLNADGTDKIKDFRRAWNRVIKEAGLGEGYGAGYEGGLKFHDLKRTCFVLNEEAGVPRSITMELSGTKSETIFERYNIVDRRRLNEAIKRREDFINENEDKKPETSEDKKPETSMVKYFEMNK